MQQPTEAKIKNLKIAASGWGTAFLHVLVANIHSCVFMTKKFPKGHVKYVVSFRQSLTKLEAHSFSKNYTLSPFAGSHLLSEVLMLRYYTMSHFNTIKKKGAQQKI